MSAMPERVWVTVLGTPSGALHAHRYREAHLDPEPYIPESRLREVEAERDALKEELDNGGAGQVSVVWVGGDEWHDEWCAWYKPEEWPLGSHRAASAFIAQKVATLRAELKALKEGRES